MPCLILLAVLGNVVLLPVTIGSLMMERSDLGTDVELERGRWAVYRNMKKAVQNSRTKEEMRGCYLQSMG